VTNVNGSAPIRSRVGLARSFQIPSLLDDLTALDNVALAVQAHRGHSFWCWRNARRDDELRKAALATLARVGLSERAGVSVDNGSWTSPWRRRHSRGCFCSTDRWPVWDKRNPCVW
jgi:ABC-type branched-subunit amino acid transport system ATPase component